jgi:hypothetical protein
MTAMFRGYWQRYGSEIEAAETQKPAGAEPNLRLDRYSRNLRRTVRKRIEDSFTAPASRTYPRRIYCCV